MSDDDLRTLTSSRPGYWCKAFRIWGTNKSIEIERIPEDRGDGEFDRILIYALEFRLRRKIDHGGFSLEFQTPDNEYLFRFYDVRHWDRENEEYEDLNSAYK